MLHVKKFASISVFVLYLLFSLGIVVKAHYCGGDLAAINLFEKGSCCCENPKIPKKEDCCKDEVKPLKISNDQIKSESTIYSPNVVGEIPPTPFYILVQYTALYSSHIGNSTLPDPPERSSFPPRYTTFHCLTFYS